MGLQAIIARTLLKLPDGMLIRMSGGRPVVIEGRTLDARAQFMAARAKTAPPIRQQSVAQVRAGMDTAAALAQSKPRPGIARKELAVPGPAGPLKAWLYEPAGGPERRPLLVYFHQGGGVIGSPHHCHAWCTILADTIGCRVLSVDYRLAPEHKHPAAIHDAVAAYQWARASASELKHDERIAVGGDSMGGYLSAVLCQEMKRTGGPQPAAQLLIYPATDRAAQGGSVETMGEAWPLTTELLTWFLEQYLPPEADAATDPYASPLTAPDCSGLAPALVYTAGFDILRDQGCAYAERLKSSGVDVTYREYPTLCHAFTLFAGVVPAAAKALDEIAADAKRVLG